MFSPCLMTELLTNGYVKGCNAECNTMIPTDIVKIILQYISDYFSNYGEYTWKISDITLIKAISEATSDKIFESPIFQMSKLKWKMQIRVTETQRLHVLLKPLSFDPLWDKIVLFRMIEYVEGKCRHAMISAIPYQQSCRLLGKNNFAENVMKNGSITIKITVDILKVLVSKSIPNPMIRVERNEVGRKYHFIYHINESNLRIMRTTSYPMYSDIFDDRWLVSFYVNGVNNANFAEIYFHTCIWPAYTKELHILCRAKCKDTGDEWCSSSAAVYKMDHVAGSGSTSKGKQKWFLSSKLKNIKTATIVVDIEIAEQVVVNIDEYIYEEIVNPIDLATMLNTARCLYSEM